MTASRLALEETDFETFRRLAGQSLGMTAHVIYDAIDETRPATLSPTVISEIIRGIGFDGLLMSDDLSMKALSGALSQRTEEALSAGCDLVPYCNGDLAEMSEDGGGGPVGLITLCGVGGMLQVHKRRASN